MRQRRRRVCPGRQREALIPADWPGKETIGGDIRPVRSVYDPHPVYNGMAVDSQNGMVVMSDQNNGGILVYDVRSGSQERTTTTPKTHITNAGGFMAGVTVDPVNREIYIASNDGGGLSVWSYDWTVQRPRALRELSAPHQAWGVSLDLKRDEIAVTSQQYQGISIYERTAKDADRPIRTIRGDKTMMADPHGVYLDGTRDEVVVANHGSWTEMRSLLGRRAALAGRRIHSRPVRAALHPCLQGIGGRERGSDPPIQGKNSKLAWPMSLDVHGQSGELAVANYGIHEILVYSRSSKGDVAPMRKHRRGQDRNQRARRCRRSMRRATRSGSPTTATTAPWCSTEGQRQRRPQARSSAMPPPVRLPPDSPMPRLRPTTASAINSSSRIE